MLVYKRSSSVDIRVISAYYYLIVLCHAFVANMKGTKYRVFTKIENILKTLLLRSVSDHYCCTRHSERYYIIATILLFSIIFVRLLIMSRTIHSVQYTRLFQGDRFATRLTDCTLTSYIIIMIIIRPSRTIAGRTTNHSVI